MRNIEYKILKLLHNNALDIPSIKIKLKKENPVDIENTIALLEEDLLIDDLYERELKVYKTENIDNLNGQMGPLSGHYISTIEGLRLMEEEHANRTRFYMPFIFSGLISLIGIIVSIISAIISLFSN